ncbi:RCC1/BLIP-II protein [Aureobasidium sp. EXF-8846]|nr:RCC1/BLIP-II protein [Aureobasidium sp. EXF-8846]
MLPKTSIPKLGALPSARAASTRASIQSRSHARVLSAPAYAARRQQHFLTSLAFVTAAAGIATVSQYYLHDGTLLNSAHAEAPPADQPDIQFEKRRKRGANKDEDRDLASSQHLQVRKSWENPGVYACGSNTGKVVAPDSDASFIKTPRRIPFFDGKLLRDIKLDKNFGVAIDEQGNLLQWGVDYSRETTQPTVTLKGKNLVKLAISKDRILGLSSSGNVYSLPVSAADQAAGTMPTESSWIPFWSSTSNISYRTITPTDMSYSERVSSIDSGLEHALLLTSKGRLFSMASATDSYPTRGQLGVPGISWDNKPNGPYYQPHELTTLRGFNIAKIACGDYHSIVADTDGRVFAFGNNTSGQLGFDYNTESAVVDTPALLPLQKLYAGSSQVPVVTSVAAGGANSFLTVDATRVASRNSADNRNVGRITADTFACGAGIYGSLGNSRWTHVQGTPAKIPSLSGLFEYDETANAVIPIRLASISAGNKHVAAVMDNVAHTGALNTDGETWWGRDIVFWGGNEHYQIGTGKRNNLNTPTYIQPLDQVAERKVRGKEEHRFQITPRSTVRLADGRKVSMEQRVECGRDCTAIYSGL